MTIRIKPVKCSGILIGALALANISMAATITVPTDHATIAAAIAAASSGDTISILDGTYTPASTLNLNMPLTVSGQSEVGVVLDMSAVGGYGFSIATSDVTLENFSILPPTPNYPIHASGTSNPPNGFDNLTIQNVTISGIHQRTGYDIHGYNNVLLSHLTSSDATGGNGVQVTGCIGVTMDNITTSNNAWGSIAIYSSGPSYLNRGSANVVIDGNTCVLSEGNIYNQDEFGLFNTNIAVTGYDFLVKNPALVGYDLFRDTIVEASATALAVGAGSTILEIATGNYMVVAGMGIQPAIDAASPGDIIAVGAGTYEEQLNIDKALTINGSGSGSCTVLSPVTLTDFYTTSAANYPIVFIHDTDGVTFADFTVDGAGRGNSNYRFQGIGFNDAGGTIQNCNVINIEDTPFSGSQHGNAIYVWDDVSARTVSVSGCNFSDYQKTGVTFNGSMVTGSISNCVVTGKGATGVTAQNGIQFGFGAGGSIADCTVSGNIYTGGSWAATGALLYQGTSVAISGSCLFQDNYVGVLAEDCDGSMTGGTISNQDPDSWDGIYVRTKGARSAGDRRASPMIEGNHRQPQRANHSFSLDGVQILGHDRQYSWGVLFYSEADVLTASMTNCVVKNFDIGTYAQENGGTLNSTSTGSHFSGNTSFGFFVDAATVQMATGNWWGDASGPFDNSDDTGSGGLYNPLGLGDTVSDGVNYDPWLSIEYDISHAADVSLISVADLPVNTNRSLLTYAIDPQIPGNDAWRQVTVWVSWDPLYLDPLSVTSVFSHVDGTVFNSSQTANQLEISTAIFGLTAGQSTAADLFTIEFDGIAEPPSGVNFETLVTIDNVIVRDLVNVNIASSWQTPLAIQVDGTQPDPIPDDFFGPGSEPFCIGGDILGPVTPTDNIELYSVQSRIDPDGGPAGAWVNAIGPNIVGPAPGLQNWLLDTSALVDGDYTLLFQVIDEVGYVSTTVDFDFHLDTAAPVAATDLDATPGFHECDVWWTAGSANDDYTLYYKLRPGYPYASGLVGPSGIWDGNTANADGSVTIDADSTHYKLNTANDFVSRGVYDFMLVAEDCVNAPASTGVAASATNYFLGDVVGTAGGAYDGLVFGSGPGDLGILGAIYGTTPATLPEMEMNIGPTSDYSSYGLPASHETTALVNFEDLIIFAMNYGVLGPEIPITSINLDQNPKENTPVDNGQNIVLDSADGTHLLTLNGELKGFSAQIQCTDQLLSATATFPVFFYQAENDWVIDAVALNGSLKDGAQITLQFASQTAVPTLIHVDGRDTNNRALNVSTESTGSNELPQHFALSQNFPNPFNPTTTISYALADAAQVNLVVYNMLGQHVLTLVNENQSAGNYELRFDASSLASGVYVYQLQAGEFSDLKKMVLIK